VIERGSSQAWLQCLCARDVTPRMVDSWVAMTHDHILTPIAYAGLGHRC